MGSIREFSEQLAVSDEADEVIADINDARECDYLSIEVIYAVSPCRPPEVCSFPTFDPSKFGGSCEIFRGIASASTKISADV